MRRDGSGQCPQAPPPPLRIHQDPQVGQQAFPLCVGAAGQRQPAVPSSSWTMVKRFSRSERPTSLTSSGGQRLSSSIASAVTVRHGHVLGGLLQRQVVGEEQRGRAEPVPAMGPGQGQQRDVLGQVGVGDVRGGIDRRHCGPTSAELPNSRTNSTVRADSSARTMRSPGPGQSPKASSSRPRRRAQASWMMAAEPGSRVMRPSLGRQRRLSRTGPLLRRSGSAGRS